MLTHKNISLLAILLFVGLILTDYNLGLIHWSVYVIVLIAYLWIEFYGAATIQSNFHVKSICNNEQEKLEVALTFDDGPAGDQTEKVLTVLKEYKTKATFFCIGKNIELHKEQLLKIHREGHIIGNHSYTHDFWYDLQYKNAFVEDMKKTNLLVNEITGQKMQFFRPPYGVTTPALARAVKSMNIDVIGWNIRSFDTSNKDGVLNRVSSQLKPGSIILLHDSINDSEKILVSVLELLKEKKYSVVPLDQLISKKAYA